MDQYSFPSKEGDSRGNRILQRRRDKEALRKCLSNPREAQEVDFQEFFLRLLKDGVSEEETEGILKSSSRDAVYIVANKPYDVTASAEENKGGFKPSYKNVNPTFTLNCQRLAILFMAKSKTGQTPQGPIEDFVNEVAKRIRTWVARLRENYRRELAEMEMEEETFITDRIKEVYQKLNANYESLTSEDTLQSQYACRQRVGAVLTSLLRTTAGRIIDAEYGENIEEKIDLEEIENKILDFAKGLSKLPSDHVGKKSLAHDISRLLRVLGEYNDERISDDLEIVEVGSKVVIGLIGSQHLCSLFAQLQVVVVLRDALSPEEYVSEMQRISKGAMALHNDPQTESHRRWLRQELSERDRPPGPTRLSSYCLGNIVMFTLNVYLKENQEGKKNKRWLPKARVAYSNIKDQDSGFECIPWMELSCAAAVCEVTRDRGELNEFLRKFGLKKAHEILEKIRKHFDYLLLINAIEKHLPSPVSEAGGSLNTS